MKDIRVNTCWNMESEVSVIKVPFGKMRMRVHLDLSPDTRDVDGTSMTYTAEQARELAAALIKAAEEVEAEVDE
jgi:hypothetical protein